jgi:hypothetical protein
MRDSAEIHYLPRAPLVACECEWPGDHGRLHHFHVYPNNTAFIRAEAVFVFASRVGQTMRFAPLYVGQTADLRSAMTEIGLMDDLWPTAEELGFDTVHVHYEHSEHRRQSIRAELIRSLNPVLNRDIRGADIPPLAVTGAIPGALW